MSDRIPIEARESIRQFEEQEAEAAAERASRKSKRSSRKLQSPERPKSMNSRDVERLASDWGCTVEGGNGKHGKHIVAPDGRRVSLPDHGSRDLATGTLRSITNFIKIHGTSQN